MDRDLKIYFSVIGLPAALLAAGGFVFLWLEYARTRDGADAVRRERISACVREVRKIVQTPAEDGARRNALAALADDDDGAAFGAFTWTRGKGVTWQTGLAAETAAVFSPTSLWTSVGRKARHGLPNGWFPLPSAPDAAVAWARAGRNDIAGVTVDMRIVRAGLELPVFLAAGLGLVALLFLSLAAGGILLARAARRAREDSLRKTTFIDNLSHELKTPLAVIRLKTDRLLSGRLEDPAKRAAAVRAIAAENDEMIRQVDALLDLMHTAKGTRRYAAETFDLAAAARDTAAALAERFAPGGLRVAAAGPVRVRADAGAVRQILRNMIDNAAKYAASGGPVEVTCAARGGRASVAVADRGGGVPPADRERVFERFYRADNALTRTTGGSGLGLSLARAFARDMGGDVTLADRPGGGAVFTLELPEARDG